MQLPESNKAKMQEQSPSDQEERMVNKRNKKATLLSDEAGTCNCDSWKERHYNFFILIYHALHQVRTDELEQELKFMSNEMNSAMAGMRGTLTALLRRIETLENGQMQQSLGACVATKEALHLPGCLSKNVLFSFFQISLFKIRNGCMVR